MIQMNASSDLLEPKMETMESFQYDVSLSSESFSSCITDDHDDIGVHTIVGIPHLSSFELPTKILKKTSGWDSSKSFAFSNASSSPIIDDNVPGMNVSRGHNKRSRCLGSNSNLMNQYHVIAERRRREKLSQKLIALAALIPTLKKMDRASVLGEAVKYVKQLQERVDNLEEKVKQQNFESAVLVKTHLSIDEDNNTKLSSSHEETALNLRSDDAAFQEIEAKLSNKDVLLRIYCEKQHGLLGRILNEMEKFHLSIISSNSLPFGTSDLVITITAQLDENFSITVKELISKLIKVL